MKKLMIFWIAFFAVVNVALCQQQNVVQKTSSSISTPAQQATMDPPTGVELRSTTSSALGQPVTTPANGQNAQGLHQSAAPAIVPVRSAAEEEEAKDAK